MRDVPTVQPGPQSSRPVAASEPPVTVPMPLPTSLPPPPAQAGDEEYALLYVLRLIDRVIRPGTLSPVERAFVTGSKVMFEHLAGECQRMLDRKVSDVARVSPKTPRTLKATGSTPHTKPRPPKAAPQSVKATPKRAKASPKAEKISPKPAKARPRRKAKMGNTAPTA